MIKFLKHGGIQSLAAALPRELNFSIQNEFACTQDTFGLVLSRLSRR